MTPSKRIKRHHYDTSSDCYAQDSNRSQPEGAEESLCKSNPEIFANRFTPINTGICHKVEKSTGLAVEDFVNEETSHISSTGDSETAMVSHEMVMEAAQRLPERSSKVVEHVADDHYHYLRGPSRKTWLARYPPVSQILPPDWTLTQLCQNYPNHLVGLNLVPFIQDGWTASRIARVVQLANPNYEELLTTQMIATRLRRVKARLEQRSPKGSRKRRLGEDISLPTSRHATVVKSEHQCSDTSCESLQKSDDPKNSNPSTQDESPVSGSGNGQENYVLKRSRLE